MNNHKARCILYLIVCGLLRFIELVNFVGRFVLVDEFEDLLVVVVGEKIGFLGNQISEEAFFGFKSRVGDCQLWFLS